MLQKAWHFRSWSANGMLMISSTAMSSIIKMHAVRPIEFARTGNNFGIIACFTGLASSKTSNATQLATTTLIQKREKKVVRTSCTMIQEFEQICEVQVIAGCQMAHQWDSAYAEQYLNVHKEIMKRGQLTRIVVAVMENTR